MIHLRLSSSWAGCTCFTWPTPTSQQFAWFVSSWWLYTQMIRTLIPMSWWDHLITVTFSMLQLVFMFMYSLGFYKKVTLEEAFNLKSLNGSFPTNMCNMTFFNDIKLYHWLLAALLHFWFNYRLLLPLSWSCTPCSRVSPAPCRRPLIWNLLTTGSCSASSCPSSSL